MQRIRSIQMLRALAALSVVQLHTLNARGYLLGVNRPPAWDVGHVGVDVFFVISGFIMTRLAMEAPSAGSFLARRFLRVAPIYWLLSIPWVFIDWSEGKLTWGATAATFAFWPAANAQLSSPIALIGWTLCYEAAFYVSVAGAKWIGRFGPLAICAGWGVAFAAWLAGSRGAAAFLGSPLMLEFGLGVLVALRPIKPRPWMGSAVLLAGLGAVLATGALSLGPLFGVTNPGLTLAIARVSLLGPVSLAIFWGGLQLEPWLAGRWEWAVGLGDASFALYLIHPLVLFGLLAVWPKDASLIFVPVAAALCVGAGLIVHRWLEQPLLDLLRRRPRPQPPLAVAATVEP